MNDLFRQHRTARRVTAAVIGGTLIAIGSVLIVTPGPGTPIMAAGLGVLALEFYWARRWLVRLRRGLSRLGHHHHR